MPKFQINLAERVKLLISIVPAFNAKNLLMGALAFDGEFFHFAPSLNIYQNKRLISITH